MRNIIAAHVAAATLGLALLMGPAFAAADDAAPAAAAAPPQAAEPATAKIPARYEFYAKQGLLAAYRGKSNPYKEPTVPLVIKGADTYNARCASCHGLMGFGNGQAGGALRPRPADLAWSLSNPKLKDDFLFWTIAEGGAQFGSNMPAYKADLKEHQIWELITYMRAAFEGREAAAPADAARRTAALTDKEH
jgi:mono/diheme cytochrome c family protein